MCGATESFDEWCARWLQRQTVTSLDSEASAASLDHANPVYIPRNHLVEHALAAATDGDMAPFHLLLDAVTRPLHERPGWEPFADPSPDGLVGYPTDRKSTRPNSSH